MVCRENLQRVPFDETPGAAAAMFPLLGQSKPAVHTQSMIVPAMGTLGVLCCLCNVNCSVFGYLQKAFAPEYLSNWVLVAVAIGAGLIAFLTLRGIQSQVDSASKAADAAAKSADAVVLSERAIVIARPEFPGDYITWGDPKRFWWSVKNTGKTPAIVLETQAVFELVDDGALNELPVKPNFPKPIDAKGLQLVEGDSYAFYAYLGPAGAPRQKIDAALSRRLQLKHTHLRCYGYVRYRDIFELEHYARFCHYWQVVPSPTESSFKWLLGAPAAYFEQT